MVVEVQRITKRYRSTIALRNVSFRVQAGTVTGILGPNGAGKTTTIRILLDILPADSGSVRILGEERVSRVRHRIGYLPEERGLYPKMRVRDVVAFFGELKGMPRRSARRSTERWLERLGLDARAESRVEEFSKGMQQKVQLACALVHEPDLVILDEPLSGLDPVAADAIKDVVLEVARSGRTVLLSTHVMDQAERMCDAIVLIDRGQVLLDGSVAEVQSRWGHDTVTLIFEGDGSFLTIHPSVARANVYSGFAEIVLRPDANPQDLLASCLRHLRIRRYEVHEPSLHEIFVRLVSGQGAPEGQVSPFMRTRVVTPDSDRTATDPGAPP